MKKTLVAVALTMAVSIPAQASNYFLSDNAFQTGKNSIGVERMEFETDNDGSLGSLNMFSLRRDYDLSDYISLSFSASLPIDNEITNVYQNTYYESEEDALSGDVEPTVRDYENKIKPSALLGVDLKMLLPIHKRLTGFITVGGSYTRVTHSGYFMEDNTTGERFDRIVDIQPALNGSRDCDITGGSATASGCKYSINSFDDKYSSFGYSYGAGFNVNLNNASSFVLQYKKYNYDEVLNSEGVYLGYQWVF